MNEERLEPTVGDRCEMCRVPRSEHKRRGHSFMPPPPAPVSGDTREEWPEPIDEPLLPFPPLLNVVSGDTEPARCQHQWEFVRLDEPDSRCIKCGQPKLVTALASDDGTPTDPPRCGGCRHPDSSHYNGGAAGVVGCNDCDASYDYCDGFVPAPEPEGTARDDDPKDDEFQRDYWARIDADREGAPALSEAEEVPMFAAVHAPSDPVLMRVFVHDFNAELAQARAPLERELEQARRWADHLIEAYAHNTALFRRHTEAAEEQLRAQSEALRVIAGMAFPLGKLRITDAVAVAERALAEQGEGRR